MLKKHSYVGLLAVFLVMLSACGGTTTEQPDEAEGPMVIGMPNPASAHCEEQGGTLDIRTDSQGGEYGVCVFADGSECEEWDFFNGECQPGDFETAPSPVLVPSYVNEQYGFSFDPPGDYAIEGWENYTLFKRDGYVLFIGYKQADEDIPPFRTGMPAGEFEDGGTIEVWGQQVTKSLLVYEGKVKLVQYGDVIEIDNLQLFIWLESESDDYAAVEIPAELIAEVDRIVSSFALTSGGTP